IQFVAVNDITDAKTLAHLLKYDSVRVGNLVRKVSKDRVVLQEVREGLGIRDVIHGYELNVLVIQRCAHDIATDAAEALIPTLIGMLPPVGGRLRRPIECERRRV